MELSGSTRKRADLTHREKQQGPPVEPVEPVSLDQMKQRVQESDLEHIVPPAKKRHSGKKPTK
jgi:hypothetical protein